MTDITVGKGRITCWKKGDVFKITLGRGSQIIEKSLTMETDPNISEERTTLLDAMEGRTDVEIIIRIGEGVDYADLPGQTRLEVE